MKKILAALLPLFVVAGGLIGAITMIQLRQQVESITPATVVRGVRVATVERGPITFDFECDGTVQPRTETTLVAEVSGRISAVESVFETGAFVTERQKLLTLDRSTYDAALASADAELARARAVLARETSEAELALREWASFGSGEPPALARREPQLAEARAVVKSAEARRDRAKIDLERTDIRAPYDGRIRDRFVDAGQFVAAGTPIATIYSTDFAEIRVAVPPSELAFVDLPLRRVIENPAHALTATVHAEYGGETHEWSGYVARTEGEVDRTTRMIYAVIRVPDPYGRVEANGDEDRRIPLLLGSFVTAKISGRRIADGAEVPRQALKERTVNGEREWQALVVDGDERLRLRPVEVLRLHDQTAVIGRGLSAGERLCISPIDIPIDGMRVRVVSEKRGVPTAGEAESSVEGDDR